MADIALISTDGTVRPIYNRLDGGWSTGGVTDRLAEVNHWVNGVAPNPDVSTNYYHIDHLGSARLVTSVNGYPTWRGTYLSFGYEWNAQATPNNYKFTGKERDAESNLDNFGARYFGSNFARFMSPDEFTGGPVSAYGPPDPAPSGALPYADITYPQSLNKYAYVYDNPVRYVDPTGHQGTGCTPLEKNEGCGMTGSPSSSSAQNTQRVAPVSVVLTGGFAREEARQPWPSSVRRAHPQPPKCLEAFGGGANLAACHTFIDCASRSASS